jgi:N-acetylglutamate synthase-like GNAT family acetyltransferase
MDCVVRPYRDADRDPCRELWRVLTQTHRDLYDDQSIGGDGDLGDYFDEHLQQAGADRVWVAEIDGRVVGFASLLVAAEGSSGELEPIVVAPDTRGAGIGRALAEQVLAAARTLGLRRVDVRPVARNDPAIGFFHELGFDSLGQLELMIYLVEPNDWPVRAQIAGRNFRA